MDITKLSAEDKARLVTRGGYDFKWLEDGLIAVKYNACGGWVIRGVDPTGKCGHQSGSFDLILPPRKIERKVWIVIPREGVYHSKFSSIKQNLGGFETSFLAQICLDLSITEGEGLDGNVRTYRLVPVEDPKEEIGARNMGEATHHL